MAEELKAQKDSLDESAKKAEESAKTKTKKDKKSKSKKTKKKGIVKYFKDSVSEFKKVVWPTPKETTHNTIVVLAMCGVAALFVFGIDSLFGLLNGLLFK